MHIYIYVYVADSIDNMKELRAFGSEEFQYIEFGIVYWFIVSIRTMKHMYLQ